MKSILFVNHRQKACGVNQMGQRYYNVLKETKKYITHYIDVDERWECEHWMRELQPAAVIYNFYGGATMPWLSDQMIADHKPDFKQLVIYHELPVDSKGFDLILHQDPNSTDPFPHWNLPRCMPEYHGMGEIKIPYTRDVSSIPRFGSFGFGLGGKGYGTLAARISAEYDEAILHLHIPFAYFGDSTGSGAAFWVEEARKNISKSGIILETSHDFWEESRLLDWLSQNTCNCFLYDGNIGRGISGTADYALAAGRPLAITKSDQFRHIWRIDDSFCVENSSLRDIIARGTDHLEKFHTLWSHDALVASFEQAFESLGV